MALPVLPVQLLWINMVTSLLLGLTLVFEPKEKDLMLRPPRDSQRPLLTFPLMMRTGLISLIMLLGCFWLFNWELHVDGESPAAARTAVVNVIVCVEIAYLFNCRSLHHSLLEIGFFSNRVAIVGALAMLGAQLLFTYLPAMNKLFHSAPIDMFAWSRILAVVLTGFLVVEVEKWLRFGRGSGAARYPE
jgi:magnesium-transporting ATPase (P-type)